MAIINKSILNADLIYIELKIKIGFIYLKVEI